MATRRKRGRPSDELGTKSATLSLRIQPTIRKLLAGAASKNRRSLNKEIISRLRSTLGREERPRHIRALSEVIELAVLRIERATGRQFNEDRYTAEQVAKGIELLLRVSSPETEAVPPPAVVARVKANAPGQYLSDTSALGTTEAGMVSSLLEMTAPPPLQEEHWPPMRYPEEWWGLWQVREHLKPRRRK